MAENYWKKIPKHFPFVHLNEFVVMPKSKTQPKNQFEPQSKNLASIIRGYKIGVTKNAKQINPNWQWQPRFYDHVIRDEVEFNKIRNYIIDNPKKWNDDFKTVK